MLADFVTYAGYGLALILAIGLLVVGLAVREVLALRLRAGRIENMSCDKLPVYAEPLCAATVRRLRALGFESFLCERQDELLASPHAVRWARVFVHLDEKVFASVAVAAAPDARNTCEVELVSFFADGHILVTMDGKAHTMIPCLDWLGVQDGYSGDLDAQWALHRKGAADHVGGRSVLVDSRAYAASGERLLREYPARLLRIGWVRPAERVGTYRFGFLRALRFALRMLRQGRRVSAPAARPSPGAAGEADSASLAQAQAVAYQRQEDLVRHRPGGWLGKTTLFLFSVALFVLAFGIQFSGGMVVIILGVLLLHELGHVLAMRIFGYRDLQILFIPFLGAAASGAPRQPKAYQELIVALMGPVPGIVIGDALMHAAAPELGGLLWQVGLIMLVLNYLNLLPVMPLDGGQVMNLLLFSRYPRLRGLFTLLSAGALAYAGLIWDEPILWALAVLMLFGVSGQLQIAALIRELGAAGRTRAGPQEPESALLEQVFRVLPRTRLAKQAFANQYQFVRGVLEQLRQTHATWPVALGALAIYCALLAAPPALMIRDIPALGALVAPGLDPGQEQPEPPDWDAGLAEATTAEARWDILMEAGGWFADSEQYREAVDYYARAEEVAEGFGLDDPRLARTLVRVSSLGEGDVAEERARLERALAIQERALGPEHQELAETLEALAMVYRAENDELSEVVAALRRAVDIRRRAQGEQHPEVAETLTTLAYVYDTHGLFQEAETHHKAAVEIYRTALGPSDSRTQLAEERLADLYLSQGDFEQAAALLELPLQRPLDDDSMGDIYARSRAETALGWTRLFQDDYGSAQRLFEAALRTQDRLPGFFGGDPGRTPLLLDLVYVHAAQERWDQARAPFEEFASLAERTMRISPETFAARLEQQGIAFPRSRADWRDRRRQAQARGIRLMLEH